MKFTAEEVRNVARQLDGLSRQMLNAFADTLSKPADSGRVDEEAERAAYGQWFAGEQGKCYDGGWVFGRAAWLARAALAAQGQGGVPEGMQPSRPKPHIPVGMMGPEDFCFCGNEVSLQSVSGGGSLEGYLGSVRLKIGGRFVSYIRSDIAPPLYKASPAGVPDDVFQDAERYRWLRTRPAQIGALLWRHAPWTHEDYVENQARLDLCIDEERVDAIDAAPPAPSEEVE